MNSNEIKTDHIHIYLVYIYIYVYLFIQHNIRKLGINQTWVSIGVYFLAKVDFSSRFLRDGLTNFKKFYTTCENTFWDMSEGKLFLHPVYRLNIPFMVSQNQLCFNTLNQLACWIQIIRRTFPFQNLLSRFLKSVKTKWVCFLDGEKRSLR